MPLILPSNTITGGYEVANSLRFNDDSSDYLIRTPASAGNQSTWTYSVWIKRGNLGSGTAPAYTILSGDTASSYGDIFRLREDKFNFRNFSNSTNYYFSDRLYRDTSAWYHFVIKYDGANSVVQLYVNGESEGSVSIGLNENSTINDDLPQMIGIWESATPNNHFDGYMAEAVMIDGQALEPTSFGEFDEDTGIWKPINVSGLTFGTNGFYLDFENSGSLGADVSGNGNNFTVNNLTSDDQMIDTPTNNFCVLNIAEGDINRSNVSAAAAADLSEGNLEAEADIASGNYSNTRGTIGIENGDTNKYYFENTIKTFNSSSNLSMIHFGLAGDPNMAQSIHNRADNLIYYYRPTTAQRIYNETTIVRSDTGLQFVANDVLQVAYDAGTGKMWFGLNNSWFDASSGTTGDPSTGTNPTLTSTVDKTLFPVIGGYTTTGGTAHVQRANFGQEAFAYTPPSGFVALSTSNLSSPTTDKPSDYFNTVLYAGDNSTSNAITGVGFQPDLIWIKNRSAASSQLFQDSVRGKSGSNYLYLQANDTAAEAAQGDDDGLNTIGSDGFTVGYTNSVGWNGSGNNYVSWNWLADGTASSNTDGSITSSVSANTTSGFSICTFDTGASTNISFGHGLGTAPSMVICKNRESAGSNWVVGHGGLGWTKWIKLNGIDAALTSSDAWQNTAPTSSVITSTTTLLGANQDYVAYCFAEKKGYSKAFSYTGNGSTDGTFTYLGFKPAWVFLVSTGSNGYQRFIFDNKRDTYNLVQNPLAAQADAAEPVSASGYRELDFLSNGIKIRASLDQINFSGQQYIGFAIAENPFTTSTGIPTTAR